MGERVTVYETTDEGWAWGQLAADGYVGWLPANALCRAGPAADAQGHRRCARFVFPGPVDQAAAARGAAARRAARGRASRRAVRASRRRAAIVPAVPSRAARRGRARFRRRRRALPRHALSVGRQDQPRPRLLRPRAGRARPPAASPARATATCRSARSARPLAADATRRLAARRSRLLEGPCRASCATRRRCCTPMRFHMAVAIEPLARRIARIRASRQRSDEREAAGKGDLEQSRLRLKRLPR